MPGVGRAKKPGALPHTTFRLTKSARKKLAAAARERGVSMTAVLEMLIRGLL